MSVQWSNEPPEIDPAQVYAQVLSVASRRRVTFLGPPVGTWTHWVQQADAAGQLFGRTRPCLQPDCPYHHEPMRWIAYAPIQLVMERRDERQLAYEALEQHVLILPASVYRELRREAADAWRGLRAELWRERSSKKGLLRYRLLDRVDAAALEQLPAAIDVQQVLLRVWRLAGPPAAAAPAPAPTILSIDPAKRQA